MHRTIRMTVAAVAAVSMGTTAAWAAEGDTGSKTWKDKKGEAAASVDITTLKASWEPTSLTARVNVKNLRGTGVVRVGYAYHGEYQHAIVKKTADGITKKIGYFDPSGEKGYSGTYACPDMDVRWNAKRDFVRVSFTSQECHSVDDGIYGVLGARVERGSKHDQVGYLKFVYD